jgi:hypothetical protein
VRELAYNPFPDPTKTNGNGHHAPPKLDASVQAHVAPAPSPLPAAPAPARDLDALKSLDIVAFNSAAEERFVELIAELASKESLHITTAMQEAAFELNISIETAKRYLIKHSARRAEFEIVGNVVHVRK